MDDISRQEPHHPGVRLTKPDPEHDAGRQRRARRLILGVVLVVAALVAYGAWGSYERNADAAQTLARINEVPTVRIMVAKEGSGASQLNLPGTMEAYDAATVYARATGYIAARKVDFGSHVKAGDVLAVIAAPDLDQQLAQGRAQLVQAQANERLARATNDRTKVLVADGWQTKQQGDTDELTLQADIAATKSAEANLSRLQSLTKFEQVTAPFDGVITNREIDVGSLVSADTNSGTPLFDISHSDTLRVQVYVPQDSVFDLHEGAAASVVVPELTGRSFKGTVSRMASALNEGTRTMLIQVDVPNEGGALRPGLYCTVSFDLKSGTPSITVPSQAIIFNKNGLSVAVVDGDKVRVQPIDLAEDNGASVEVKTGLKQGDQVILSPPVNLIDGMKVNVGAS